MAPLSTSLTSSRKSYWIWVLSLALKSRKRPSYRSSRETLEAEQARLAVAGEAEAEAEEADSPEMAVVGAVSPEIAAEADASLAVAFREAAIEAAAADIPPETAEASNAEIVVVLNAETAAAVVVLNAETVAAAAVAVDIPPEAETAEKVVIPPPALGPAAVAATGPCNKSDTMVPGT